MTVNRRLVTVVGRSVGLYEQCVGGTLSSGFERIHYIALSRCLLSSIKFSDASLLDSRRNFVSPGRLLFLSEKLTKKKNRLRAEPLNSKNYLKNILREINE